MTAEELKTKLKEIFGSNVLFNKEFDVRAQAIKNIDQRLIEWCIALKEQKIRPAPAPNMQDGLVFVKKIGSSNRCIIIKVKNGEFTEIHLGDHNYYDRLRKVLGLKKDS